MNEQCQQGLDSDTARNQARVKAIIDEEIAETLNRALDETDDAVIEEELRFVRAAAYRFFTRLDVEDGGWEDVAPRRQSPSPRSGGLPGSEAAEGLG